jgi:hypothetical protein
MKTWERRAFAQTMVKRLYWSGYKGKCGLFSWPTEWQDLDTWYRAIPNAVLDPRLYDRSEVQARHSGRQKLPILLQDLDSRFGADHVELVAHSMGNIVASEALSHSSTQLVRRYNACQSAEIAHTVDENAPPLTGNIKLSAGPFTLNYDPAEYAPNYPGPNLYLMKSPPNPRPISDPPGVDLYHSGLSTGAGSIIGYWNDGDPALGGWGVNQLYKPDLGYQYAFSFNGDHSDHFFIGELGFDLGNLNWGNSQGPDFARILAFIVQARSLPVGRCGNLSGQFDQMRPLSILLPGVGGSPGDHSLEFLSTFWESNRFWDDIAFGE